ncbi:hypothetical protein AB0G04_33050 [Actinoplanes sp. NPDC023801]|uniref:hypothetical protein n=1 Tax=Actinoplanes sp. NPDC023801 TaxID=3154595 RepID=UPI0033DB7009
MEFQYWHLGVVAAFVILVIVGMRVSTRRTLVGLGAALMLAAGFLFYTLILDEEYLDMDANARLDAAALIGVPAVLGVGLVLLAVKRARRSRV